MGIRRTLAASTAALVPALLALSVLAARGESLAAFDRRGIPAGGVAPPSNTPGMLGRRALPTGRLARLDATPDFHHGLLAARGGQDKPRVNADAALSVEFLKGVQAYVDLHNKLEATLPPRPEKAAPAEVEAHETALAKLIVQARSQAKQGDIFPQPVRAYFRRQITRALAGPEGRAIRQSLTEENPARVQLRVNSRFPDGIPLTTMPPEILGALPKLPEHLEYRFIGKRLVLLDLHAQLVVDYIDGALS